jgi:hypothetical protein
MAVSPSGQVLIGAHIVAFYCDHPKQTEQGYAASDFGHGCRKPDFKGIMPFA